MAAGAHHHDHDHHHEPVTFVRSDVPAATLPLLDGPHPVLSEILSLSQRYPDLSDGEREDLVRIHEQMEREGPFLVGFHAEGDTCAVCGGRVEPLFQDLFEGAEAIPFGAFASDLPVHVDCAPKFPEKYPKLSPRVLDQAKRATMRDLDRPSAAVASFFRHDVLKHRTFELEDWANSVYEANKDGMTRALTRDVEKCIRWVHGALHHPEA